ncbi:MAG: nuclear transport factor 2 family protein [Acidobacteria bacterium]|nr:nuclear transport factor 2 family protein [Acidobacteriota bacterium]
MTSTPAENRQVVERYWECHFRRAWDEMKTYFSGDAHYTDAGVDPTGATGGNEIIQRLRLGIEPLSGYYHFPKHMIAEGHIVVTEHMERWEFPTGEAVDHPFASVMEVADGKITRWHDYSHLNNILDMAPAWWITHISGGWADGLPAIPTFD